MANQKIRSLTIRQEDPHDYREVFALVTCSFKTSPHSEGDEADYLNQIRGKEEFIPELSLVAVAADTGSEKIVGQIVLYKTSIRTKEGDLTELVLSPLSVHPDYFKQGIARTLIETALQRAAELGFNAVFLCGDPGIYSRLGFKPSYEYQIRHVNDKAGNAEWSMVREITQGFLGHFEGQVNTL